MSFLKQSPLLAMVSLFTLCARAEQVTPFATLFRTADVVLVGSITSTKGIMDFDSRSRLSPLPALQVPLHACELMIRTAELVKGSGQAFQQGATFPAVTFLPAPDCAVSYLDNGGRDKPSLWLLRYEQGTIRTLVDNAATVRPLQAFSQETARKLREWREPSLAVMYLFLKPGVIVPESEYADAGFDGSLIDLAGWAAFLSVYRAVYLESDERLRRQISLVTASSFGHCLDMASRAAQGIGRQAEWARLPEINPETRRREDDLELRRMSWTTKEEVLAAFKSSEAALDELTFRACSSANKSKTRARQLLMQYFNVDPSTLPCIPCD